MGNDIEIRVRVANDTAGGLTSVNQALRGLRDNARDAGQSLQTLGQRATVTAAAVRILDQRVESLSRSLQGLTASAATASSALRGLRDSTTSTNTSLRGLNTRAQTADGRLSTLSDRTRTLRTDTDDLDGSMRRLTGTMGGLRGSLGTVSTSTGGAGNGMQKLKAAAIALSPALIPIAAAAVPLAAGMAAAGTAVAAFGLAIGGQVAGMLEAAEAQKKLEKAVREHGKGSEQAAKAETEYLRLVAEMPPATRRAAAALTLLKDGYKDWTDSLADDTMPVVTKSFATFSALLPKLSPLVRGASRELDRFMTVAAGGIESPGFERFMDSFAEFASGALARATTGLVRFSQALDTGEVGGDLAEFMAYAREHGPIVGETLGNLARALTHLVVAASDVGVSMLTAVNALAELVNAVPTGALSNMIQLYAALKLVSVGVGMVSAVATSGAAASLAAFVRSARFGGVGAAIAGVTQRMSALQKASVGLGVLAVAAIGIEKLADKARGAPPDVDRLTTSLKQLAESGKFTGELKDSFGDMDGLVEALKRVDGGVEENIGSWAKLTEGALGADWTNEWIDAFSNGEKSIKATDDAISALDESLASMVGSGYSKQAAEDFGLIRKAMLDNGRSSGEVNKAFDDYKAAVENLQAEQEIAARGMGIFGDQALKTSAMLDTQKQSADGLRQAILNLNDVNRAAYDSQIAFEASIDSLSKSFKEHGNTLNIDTEAGRANAEAMSAAAKSHDEMLASGVAAGESLGSMTKKSNELRDSMMRLATDAFDGNKKKAREYVNTLLGTPGEIKTMVKLEREEAITGLEAVQAAIDKTPGKKSVRVDTLNAAAIAALEEVGLKTRRLPDGRTEVYTANGAALGPIGAVLRALANLDGKTARTYTTHTVTTHYRITGNTARRTGAHGSQLANADGSVTDYFADGSEHHVAQMAPAGSMRVWAEPETGGEAYIPLSEAKRSRSLAILEQVADRFGYGLEQYASGGVTKKERQARSDAWSDLTISHFGRMAGFQRSEFGNALGRADGLGQLVSALNQWRGIIMRSTHGGQEKSLLKQLDSTAKSLIKYEKAQAKVTAQLEKAKDKLSDLKNAAAQLKDSVKSGLIGEANITRAAGASDSRVTINTLLSQMTGSASQSKQFADMLKQLKERGLSGDLIAQIGQAGIAGGGMETAAAILGGGSTEIGKLNTLQAQINKYAGLAGKTTADAMYEKAIKAQEKLVKELKAEQAKLTKAMAKLTKAMEKAIERAFKGKASGGIIGAATGGVRSGMTWVGEQGPELVRLPSGSRVYPAGASRNMAYAPGFGGGGQVVVHNTITLDGRIVARQIFDPLRAEIAHKGGNVQNALGQAGR